MDIIVTRMGQLIQTSLAGRLRYCVTIPLCPASLTGHFFAIKKPTPGEQALVVYIVQSGCYGAGRYPVDLSLA
ncbi:hypothetical protein QI600_004805 [Salmonella enterica]|nr:hypothetical protein [Salmonella enterica]